MELLYAGRGAPEALTRARVGLLVRWLLLCHSSSFSTFTNIPLRSPNKKLIGSPNWTLVQSFLSVMVCE